MNLFHTHFQNTLSEIKINNYESSTLVYEKLKYSISNKCVSILGKILLLENKKIIILTSQKRYYSGVVFYIEKSRQQPCSSQDSNLDNGVMRECTIPFTMPTPCCWISTMLVLRKSAIANLMKKQKSKYDNLREYQVIIGRLRG